MEANPNGMDNGNSDDLPSEPAGIDLQYFIRQLCEIASIPGVNIFSQSVGNNILQVLRDSSMETTRFQAFVSRLSDITGISTVGEDVCSESFMDSLLEYFEDQHRLVEGFRASLAERRTFRSETRLEGNPKTDPPLAYHSGAHSSSLESLEVDENNVIHSKNSAPEDVNVKPFISQIIPLITSNVPKSPQLSPEVTSTTSAQQQIPSPFPLHCVSANFKVPIPVPTETDTVSSATNSKTTTPVVSSKLADGGYQSGFPSLEDLGSSQSRNETEVGTGSGVVDSMLDEILDIPVPSTSHQPPPKEKQSPTCTNRKGTCGAKKRKGRIPKKKIHKGSDSIGIDKCYHCNCGSKFKSKVTYKYHIKYFNAQWKFKSEGCTKRFYDLSRLKAHLKKEHGEENPLKDFVIGCTLCGSMFKTRIEFGNHKKRAHNIHNVPHTAVPKRTSKPQNLEQGSQSSIQDQHEVFDLVSDDEEDQEINEGGPSPPQPDQQQPHSNGLMNGNQRERENFSVETSPGFNVQNGRRGYGECYGCIMCTQAFGDPQQLKKHLEERHQSEQKKVKCGICGMVCGTSKSFHVHRNQNHRK